MVTVDLLYEVIILLLYESVLLPKVNVEERQIDGIDFPSSLSLRWKMLCLTWIK